MSLHTSSVTAPSPNTHTPTHTHTHTPTPTHTHPHTHFIHSLLSNLTGDGLALSLQIIPTPSLECSFSSPKLFKSHQAFNECCRDVPFIKPSVMALTLLWSAPALEICSMFLAHACCGRGGREGAPYAKSQGPGWEVGRPCTGVPWSTPVSLNSARDGRA